MQLLKNLVRPFIEPYKIKKGLDDTYLQAVFRILYIFPSLPPSVRRTVLSDVMRRLNSQSRYYTNGETIVGHNLDDIEPQHRVYLVSTEMDYRYDWLLLATQNPDYAHVRIVFLPIAIFSQLFNHYLGAFAAPHYTFDYEKIDRHQAEYDKQLAKYTDVIRTVFETLIEMYHVDALVTASVGDSRWFLAAPIAQEIGLPWVVTEREGVVSPGVYRHGTELLRKYFQKDVDLMIVNNDLHHKRWQGSGLSEQQLARGGELKNDYWLYPDRWRPLEQTESRLDPNKITIVYFTFGLTNYIGRHIFPEITEDWQQLKLEHFNVLKQIGQEFPDVQIILKYGHHMDTTGEPPFDLPNVFRFTVKHQALDLISSSDIIIGFQTTALIESMFTDKPIIYPAWGDTFDKYNAEYLLPFDRTSAVYHTTSPDELYDELKQLITNNAPPVSDDVKQARREFRERYYYITDDETVGERTLRLFEEYFQSRDE